jgi:hypothetical protein
MDKTWHQRIDPSCVGLPDEETMTCTDGLVENHYYRDLRWMDLEGYQVIRADEDALLTYVEDGNDPGSDEAWEEFCDNEVYRLDLDPGVATTVAALAALGAVPFTSCTGGPGHYETHPLVGFWATEEHLLKVLEAADEVGVEVTGVAPQGVLVYTLGDVSLMRDFSEALIRKVPSSPAP